MYYDRNVLAVAMADNATESSAAQLGSSVPVGLIIPAGFITADITFQASADGANFYNLEFDNDGAATPVGLTGVTASKYIALDPLKFIGANLIKVVSSVSQTGGPLTLGLMTRQLQ